MRGEHTPGPWFADGNEAGGSFMVTDGTGAVLCDRAPWESRAKESSANARLIAAAPDMLEALRWLRDNYAAGRTLDINAKIDAVLARAEATP